MVGVVQRGECAGAAVRAVSWSGWADQLVQATAWAGRAGPELAGDKVSMRAE